MAFKYRCSDCGKYFLSFLPSWKCPECQGKAYQCDYQVEVSAELEKSIKAEAYKEFAEWLISKAGKDLLKEMVGEVK